MKTRKPRVTAAKLHAEARRQLRDRLHGTQDAWSPPVESRHGERADFCDALHDLQTETLRIERKLRRKLAKRATER